MQEYLCSILTDLKKDRQLAAHNKQQFGSKVLGD
jgi:hypothetical protein